MVECVCRQGYLTVYEQADEGGWCCSVPDLPGIFAWGTDRQEAQRRVEEAIDLSAKRSSLSFR